MSARRLTTHLQAAVPTNVLPAGARNKLQMLRNGVVTGRAIPIDAAEALVFMIEGVAADLGITLVRTEEKGGVR